uniref:Uncharacterized protein n=1 Tax=Oryza barthii TaxID=65489 RepID=A0A0D3FVW5_9ORYZ
MKVTFDGSYGIPSSVSHPAAARHRRRRDLELVGGSEPQPPDLAVMNMIVMIFVILFCAQMIVNVKFVTGLNSDPPSQVKVTCDGFYVQSVKGYIYH